MTDQRPISNAAAWAGCTRALTAAVDAAERFPEGYRMLGEAVCGLLDTVGGGVPQFSAFGDIREDAAFWADMATPVELELYAGAALRRIDRTSFAPRARKRLFWELWQTFTPQEREAFLARVKKEEPPP